MLFGEMKKIKNNLFKTPKLVILYARRDQALDFLNKAKREPPERIKDISEQWLPKSKSEKVILEHSGQLQEMYKFIEAYQEFLSTRESLLQELNNPNRAKELLGRLMLKFTNSAVIKTNVFSIFGPFLSGINWTTHHLDPSQAILTKIEAEVRLENDRIKAAKQFDLNHEPQLILGQYDSEKRLGMAVEFYTKLIKIIESVNRSVFTSSNSSDLPTEIYDTLDDLRSMIKTIIESIDPDELKKLPKEEVLTIISYLEKASIDHLQSSDESFLEKLQMIIKESIRTRQLITYKSKFDQVTYKPITTAVEKTGVSFKNITRENLRVQTPKELYERFKSAQTNKQVPFEVYLTESNYQDLQQAA